MQECWTAPRDKKEKERKKKVHVIQILLCGVWGVMENARRGVSCLCLKCLWEILTSFSVSFSPELDPKLVDDLHFLKDTG